MRHQDEIKQIVDARVQGDGLFETGIDGVKLFRATRSVPCAPVVYEPSIVAIASGAKEVVIDGTRRIYDHQRYLCCPISMPVQAGTHLATPETPLCGVYISLKPRMMAELAMELENFRSSLNADNSPPSPSAIHLADWDKAFSEALVRLLQLAAHPADAAVLTDARTRELCYAVLKGDAGPFARQAFGVGNAIARSIAHVSSNLEQSIAIDDLADHAGMSRAVFHRKFKRATTMSPIQFVKTMRLNNAAMKISEGQNVSEAALQVGYVSTSQFSREFKRLFGKSPRQWSDAQQEPMNIV